MARADAGASVGWLNGNKSALSDQSSNDWYNRGLYGAGTFGWYWTDHHKTEVEAGITNRADFYTYRLVTIGNITSPRTSEFTFRTRRVAVSERYQFFRNAWFHPHVGAGLDLTWETTTERVSAITIFDQQSRQSREIVPARDSGPETTLRARPFAETGFKAYFTPRAFFRSDIRVVARRGVDEVLLRFGFGADF